MTGQPALPVVVVQAAADAPLGHAVAGMIRVPEGEALQDAEVGSIKLSQDASVGVKTGLMRRREAAQEARVIVDVVQVIRDG